MTLSQPWALAALLLIPLAGWWARQSAAGLPPGRRMAEFVCRAAVMACLALALAEPKAGRSGAEPFWIWLEDGSASAGEAARLHARQFLEAAAIPAPHLRSLVFASRVGWEGQPDRQDWPWRTRLAEACLEALAWFPEGRARALVVFTDGVAPGEGLGEAAEQLRQQGVALFVIPTPRSSAPEAGIRGLRAPGVVREDEPFSVEAEVVSRGSGAARVILEVDGLRAGETILENPQERERVRFDVRAPQAGRMRLAVFLEPEADTLPQNNVARSEIRVQARPKVLAAGGRGLGELAEVLRRQGMEAEVRPVEAFPGHADLAAFDAVILDAEAIQHWPREATAPLKQFVQSGRGLVVVGGRGAWRSRQGSTGWEEFLPLEPVAPLVLDVPTVALILVIDKSGSMHGEKMDMAKSAALAALELLAPGDYGGVVVFDSQAAWAVKPSAASDLGQAATKLGAVGASGGTNIAAGLALAWEGLRGLDARIQHVILLSDGISSPGPYRELAARLAATGATLSTVGLGADADLATLENLARLGRGRFYFTSSPEGLPQIFLRETELAAAGGVSEQPVRAVERRRAPFLRGLPMEEAPMLLGHVRARPKAGASVWLELDTGEPLLAGWRQGLGHVVAFASEAAGPWASEWRRWPLHGAFWAQLVRSVLPPADFGELAVRWREEQERVILEVESEALSAQAPIEALVTWPRGRTESAELEPVAPGLFGKTFPHPGHGLLSAEISGLSPDGRRLRGSAAKELRPVDDGVLEEADVERLRSFAEAAGGIFDPLPQDVAAARPPPQTSERELWPFFAVGALGFFLAGLAVRRLPQFAWEKATRQAS